MTETCLIIFVKNPVLGKVKTRLAKTMGQEKALEVYKDLLRYTKEITNELDVDKLVYYDSHIEKDDLWNGPGFEKHVQCNGDLGERMHRAIKSSFDQGYQKVCIIGSDCLQLTSEIIKNAFSALNTHDTVIGPANDGGYYLLGMNHFIETLFSNKSWSTESLIDETKQTLQSNAMTFSLLPELIDVDHESDLVASGYKDFIKN